MVLPFVVMMLFGCAVAAAAAAFLPRRQFVAAVFGGCGARSVRRPCLGVKIPLNIRYIRQCSSIYRNRRSSIVGSDSIRACSC